MNFLSIVAIILALVFPPVQASFTSSIVQPCSMVSLTEAVASRFLTPFLTLSNPSEDMANDSIENFSPLDDAILTATKRACSNLTTWHSGGLCPDRDDLTGIVLLKLCSPAIRPILETIWIDPDQDRLLKFVRTVAKHTLVDEVRRQAAETRNPENGFVRLDEPIRNEDGERGTRADLISDEDETFQAFQFDDLRDQLTDDEFAVLHGIVVNRVTGQELAEERGTSDSAISRTYIRAKDKAANWIRWLQTCTEKQARAHISPTFTRRPCLRPNGITQETLERWNAPDRSMRMVQFHDEASEWHPPITKQPRVRAKRECWNGACTNGLAIGPDNLVLPFARRDEAVRYLPEKTGKENRLCAGCEQAAKQAKVLQSVDTKTAFQIGDAEPNVKAIPSTGQSADAQHSDRQEQEPYFFDPAALNRTTETRGNRMHVTELMDYKRAAETLKQYEIQRSVIARLAGLHLPDLSAWLGGKIDISEDKRERVSQWVADVAKMIQAMATLSIKVDLGDVENVRQLVRRVNDSEMQLNLALEGQPEPLRMNGTAN